MASTAYISKQICFESQNDNFEAFTDGDYVFIMNVTNPIPDQVLKISIEDFEEIYSFIKNNNE